MNSAHKISEELEREINGIAKEVVNKAMNSTKNRCSYFGKIIKIIFQVTFLIAVIGYVRKLLKIDDSLFNN